MKISREIAVGMLEDLGFSKASSWDDKKLLEKIKILPSKASREDMGADFTEVYDELVKAEGNVTIGEAEEAEKPAKAKKAKKAKPAPEEPAAEEPEPEAKPKKAKKAKKTEEPEPEAKPKKAKKEKPAKDAGEGRGAIAAAIEGAITKEWEDEVDLAKRAKLELRIARGRLYHGAATGLYERRHVIQYRRVS